MHVFLMHKSNTADCPNCCAGVPNPLATSVNDYSSTIFCETGNLTISYAAGTQTITSFSYVSCNSSNVDSSTNYNLPSGVTATSFTQGTNTKGTNYIQISGSDNNQYYFAYI